jgi:hypothetical protein
VRVSGGSPPCRPAFPQVDPARQERRSCGVSKGPLRGTTTASAGIDPGVPQPSSTLQALGMPTSLLRGRALRAHEGSAAALVEVLEEAVGGELDLLVAPFGGPILAGDQAHAVDAAEVAVDEVVPDVGRSGDVAAFCAALAG